VYYPDEVGTAYYMTRLSEHFAKFYEVGVLCGRPKYNARGVPVPRREFLNGVWIERCIDSTLDKNIFVFRLFNVFVSSLSIFLKALVRINRGDLVFVVTSPPLLPFVTTVACKVRGAKLLLRIDDVYPEVFVATGILKKGSFLELFLIYLNKLLYRAVDRIFVLGRDMARLAGNKAGRCSDRIRIIPNWADADIVFPMPKLKNPLLKELGISDKFVVQCAGNMGRAQAIETLFAAAEKLLDNKDITFLFIGSGQKVNWMKKKIREKSLKNIIFLGQRPRYDQNNFLNACDVSLVTLLPGMTGAGVPSRMYNVMAASKPIISVASEESELSLVTKEEDIGWVTSPANPDDLVKTILEARSDLGRLEEMGRRARLLAETKYSIKSIIAKYERAIEEIILEENHLKNI